MAKYRQGVGRRKGRDSYDASIAQALQRSTFKCRRRGLDLGDRSLRQPTQYGLFSTVDIANRLGDRERKPAMARKPYRFAQLAP